jgi:ABC-type lipoprotein export system ATPase subunit
MGPSGNPRSFVFIFSTLAFSDPFFHSGAGKSTLLNFLSGRLKSGSRSGEVLLNGQRVKDKHYKQLSAYVMQDDALLGNLTPREMLRYAARLRLPRNSSRNEINARVEEIIAQLGLNKCANTRVGVPGVQRGVSGGERRRTSIALEMLTNPMLLFLDEPTSGLDSQAAESVVKMLKELAQRGQDGGLHDPSAFVGDLPAVRRRVLVEQRPPHLFRSSQTVASLFQAGWAILVPRFSNPADFIMRLMAKTEDVTEEAVRREVAEADRVPEDAQQPETDRGRRRRAGTSISLLLPRAIRNTPFFYSQFFILLQRSFKQYIRDPGSTHQRLIQNIFVAVFTGLLFLQMDDDQKGNSIGPTSSSGGSNQCKLNRNP